MFHLIDEPPNFSHSSDALDNDVERTYSVNNIYRLRYIMLRLVNEICEPTLGCATRGTVSVPRAYSLRVEKTLKSL